MPFVILKHVSYIVQTLLSSSLNQLFGGTITFVAETVSRVSAWSLYSVTDTPRLILFNWKSCETWEWISGTGSNYENYRPSAFRNTKMVKKKNRLLVFFSSLRFTVELSGVWAHVFDSGSVKLSPLVHLTCSSIIKSISVTRSVTWRPGMESEERSSALRELRRRLTVTARVSWFVTPQYKEQTKAPGPVCSHWHSVFFLFFCKGVSFRIL